MTQSALEAGIARVRARFLEMLSERLEVLDDSLNGVPNASEALENAIFVVHKVAGSAGSLGLADLSMVARECENVLVQDKGRGGVLSGVGRQSVQDFQSYAVALLSETV